MDFAKLRSEHDSANTNYITKKGALFEEGELHGEQWEKLANERLNTLAQTLNTITEKDIEACPSYVETVDLFVSFFDDVILECAGLTNRLKESEMKILELCQIAVGTTMDDKTRDSKNEHAICTLIDGLVMTELPLATRGSAMTAALMHPTNPLRLGQSLYEIFCDKYPEAADRIIVDYLACENNLRKALTDGSPAEASEYADKLMNMPITSPEKYLLISMVMFYSEMTSEASRTLDIGLNEFPMNDRLLKAKEGLAAVL